MDPGFRQVLSNVFIINAVVAIVIIILERKRPEKTIAWLLIFFIFPPAGLLLYIFLGRNWKIHKLNDEFYPHVNELIYDVRNHIKNPHYFPLIDLLARNSDSPLFIDNDVKIFHNGTDKFNCLKDELMKAEHHIHLEYYIVKSDTIGTELKDILIQKSNEGVKVRFLMDRVGSIRARRSYIKELKEAGVDVVQYSYFLAPLLRLVNTQLNYRNHRKIVVIDGKVGFIGGMNIGDEYLGKGRLGYWRDCHIMVKGDFVLGLQSVFLDDFLAVKRVNHEFFYDDDHDKYFPKPDNSSGISMQLVKSGPDSEFPSIMQGVLKMITMAANHIYIVTPYFVPNESVMDALKVATLGGIDVRILFPGRYDHLTVYYASRTYLAELAKCGAKIYYYKNDSFIHSKIIMVDSEMVTVGTANMDIRSYDLNYEINAVIYDNETTEKFETQFYEDLKQSKRITENDYSDTPRLVKVLEAVARVFSTLL